MATRLTQIKYVPGITFLFNTCCKWKQLVLKPPPANFQPCLTHAKVHGAKGRGLQLEQGSLRQRPQVNPIFFFKHLNPTPTEVETYGMCDRSWCYNRIHWEDHPNLKLVGRKTSHMKLSRYQLGGGWMMTNHSKHFKQWK